MISTNPVENVLPEETLEKRFKRTTDFLWTHFVDENSTKKFEIIETLFKDLAHRTFQPK